MKLKQRLQEFDRCLTQVLLSADYKILISGGFLKPLLDSADNLTGYLEYGVLIGDEPDVSNWVLDNVLVRDINGDLSDRVKGCYKQFGVKAEPAPCAENVVKSLA